MQIACVRELSKTFVCPGYWEKIALGAANKFVRKQCRRKYCANVIKAIDLCGAAFIARIGAWALVVFLRGRIYSPQGVLSDCVCSMRRKSAKIGREFLSDACFWDFFIV